MAHVNAELHSAGVRHRAEMLRVEEGIYRNILSFLNEADADLQEQIAGKLALGREPKRLQAIQGLISERVSYMERVLHDDHLVPSLTDLAAYEIEWQAGMVEKTLPFKWDLAAPAPTLVQAIVTKNPLAGHTLKEHTKTWSDAKQRAVLREINLGLVEGQTAEQIVSRTVQPLETSRRGARAVVRTVSNATTTSARELLYAQNEDICKGIQIVATLDSRTTEICRGLDGKVFPVDSGPRPPMHFSCRSTSVPVLKSWEELGIKTKKSNAVQAYHAAQQEFDRFDPERIGSKTDPGQLGRGFYLSTDPGIKGKAPVLLTVDVDLKNPLKLSMPDMKTGKQTLVRNALGLDKSATSEEITKALKAKGHDGVILDYSPIGYKHQEIMAIDADSLTITKPGAKPGANAVPEHMRPFVKDKMSGQIAGKTTYDEWLRTQDFAFQDEILGATKAKLWREGGLTLDRFVDIETLKPYTLDELKLREAGTWRNVFGSNPVVSGKPAQQRIIIEDDDTFMMERDRINTEMAKIQAEREDLERRFDSGIIEAPKYESELDALKAREERLAKDRERVRIWREKKKAEALKGKPVEDKVVQEKMTDEEISAKIIEDGKRAVIKRIQELEASSKESSLNILSDDTFNDRVRQANSKKITGFLDEFQSTADWDDTVGYITSKIKPYVGRDPDPKYNLPAYAQHYTEVQMSERASNSIVFRHEMGHIIDALDNYSSTRAIGPIDEDRVRAIARIGRSPKASVNLKSWMRKNYNGPMSDNRYDTRAWLKQQFDIDDISETLGISLSIVDRELLYAAHATGDSSEFLKRIQTTITGFSPVLMYADFMGAITTNNVGFGHSTTEYYDSPDLLNWKNSTEAFANYVALTRGGSQSSRKFWKSMIEQNAPETAKAFDAILDNTEARIRKALNEPLTEAEQAAAS